MLAPGDMMANEQNISETKLDETVVDCATVQATPPSNAIEEQEYHPTDKVEVQELHPPPKLASLIDNLEVSVGFDFMMGSVGQDHINFDTSNEAFQERVDMMAIKENISDKKFLEMVDVGQLVDFATIQSSSSPNGIGDQNPHPTDMVEYLESHPTPKQASLIDNVEGITGHSVDRDFWLTLLGCSNRGWQPGADWAIAGPYFCAYVMRADVPFWPANGIKYLVPWTKVDRLPSARLSYVYLIRTSLGECEVHSYLGSGLKALNGPSFPPQRVHEDLFSQLPYYCRNLKLSNEGIVTHIQTNEQGRFEMLFVGFGIALAVGMDGNNQILPIPMGVTHGETGAFWTWFMNRLKECIGEVPNLCIISDRHPAIILACKTVFSNSFHGYCDRDSMMNCKFKGKKIREIASFDKWSRGYCPANRFNYMTSNSVESVNSLSSFVRKLLVTRLVEYFRVLLQRWYCDKRQKYEDTPADELTPWAAAKVKDMMLKSQSWRVNGIDALKIYQVFDNKSAHEVDCINFPCTCRKWKPFVLPCGHVCAVSRVCGLTNCNLWAQPWFMNSTLKDTYRELVYPLKVASTWEETNDLQQVLPPLMLKQPTGRPKNTNRLLSRGETPSQAGCGMCGIRGHNRNTCT
nr:hypothetical protein [Tanacetum cinerariifolium]